MTWAFRILYGSIGLAGVGLSLMYMLQEKLIYVPRIPGVSNDFVYTPDQFSFSFEDIWMAASDGIKLHAWFMWPKEWPQEALATKPTVLFLQENAGNMSWRLPFLRMLSRFLDCSVLALSYRGYGLSDGRPSERGLQLDAQAALDYLHTERPDIDRNNIAIFGRSLGGAVAIHLAANNADKVKAVIVENTFTSIEDVAPRLFPLLGLFVGPRRWFNFLVRNKWESKRDIQRLTSLPVLLLSSLKDEMLPPEHMLRLYDILKAAGSERVVWTEFPTGNHMETYELCRQEYWPAVRAFFEQYLAADGEARAEDVRPGIKAAAPDVAVEAPQQQQM